MIVVLTFWPVAYATASGTLETATVQYGPWTHIHSSIFMLCLNNACGFNLACSLVPSAASGTLETTVQYGPWTFRK